MGTGGATVSDVRDAPEAGAVAPHARPVFVDTTGRRSRTWRRAGAVTALCCVCYATTVAAALVGGDSSAPFLQLPRAMGLERGTGEPSAPAQDEDRSASATGTEPVLDIPGPLTLGPLTPGPAQPSAAARAPVPLPVELSPGLTHPPTASPSASRTTGPAPEPTTQNGEEGADGGESAPGPVTEPSAPVEEPEPEAKETTAPGGPLGDLLGGVLGGLLGGA
ncbi:hypothetical protein ACIRD8_28425 [Streptomyces sp. NPDC102451]|uniref:hypothetical protein n=1 Tax=Streptomyces sp. NPDC102451 TaxID=3366177 RepID=UPI00380C814B